MIADKLCCLDRYGLPAEYANAIFSFAQKCEKENLQEGRYDLLGEKLYVFVQTYNTKPQSDIRMEAHKRYADLQYMMSGTERIYWSSADDLTPSEDQTPGNDIMFFDGCAPDGYVTVEPGVFTLYVPRELHSPGIQAKKNESVPVRKLVFKLQWPIAE